MTLPTGDDPEFRDVAKAKPAPRRRFLLSEALLAIAILGVLIGLLLPASRSSGEASKRAQCQNNLRNIMLGLNGYAEAHGGVLPPAYTVAPDGRRLHSWRTLILPYLDLADIYQTIDLSKPWNDPVNAKAFETTLAIYRCPSAYDRRSNRTVFRASVGPHAFLRPTEPRTIATITDGQASTLAVVEVSPEEAMPWMSPEDADEAMIEGLGSGSKLQHPGGLNVGFANSSVRFLKAPLTQEIRRALITVDGGKAVSSDQY
ncbi:DUF1559 family PulG-like putative transporter [Paludisphaera rhizosphaerae]|uniref:DUF1559 family PulG-like putative transporter n=1 Tax=Paludisphaera rhizosphaerae TaxID=2711216 RepID=UPI0013EC7F04|nr:DUF1559 domain-containing protein [Paludisphaera rhizosphaerae]